MKTIYTGSYPLVIQHLGSKRYPATIAIDASRYGGDFFASYLLHMLLLPGIYTSMTTYTYPMRNILTFFFIVITVFLISGLQTVYADTMEYKNISITTNGNIYAISEQNDTLYVGGSFSTIQLEDTAEINRSNIAAISLLNRSISEWNPIVDMEVRTIEFQEDSVIAKNYVDSDEDTGNRKQVIINAAGSITEQVLITPVPTETPVPPVPAGNTNAPDAEVQGLMVDRAALGFKIPTLSDIFTFAIRGFFVIAGMSALFFLLMGAFTWITSGGDKDSVQGARDKMQSAVVGVLMMVFVLAIVWTLEQVVMGGNLCFGISCPVSIPTLLEPI
jgi:hypothetical protein